MNQTMFPGGIVRGQWYEMGQYVCYSEKAKLRRTFTKYREYYKTKFQCVLKAYCKPYLSHCWLKVFCTYF